MGWFDVHAHLTDPRLAAQEESVLQRAREAGVTTIISNGLNPVDNERVRALSQRSDLVRPAFGFYPVDTVLTDMVAMGIDYPRDDEPVAAEDGIRWLKDNVDGCFAVGEIGPQCDPTGHGPRQDCHPVFQPTTLLRFPLESASQSGRFSHAPA